jgi:hypothetical protein
MLKKLRAAIGASPAPAIAELGAVCRRAIVASDGEVRARVDYRPPLRGGATGRWDAGALARALSLLLQDAVASAGADARVELRWRVHESDAAIRIQYPRPLAPGDRLVTFFDDARERGGRAARAGLREARDAVLAQGGTLARVRTRRGTTYVVSLPRRVRAPAARAAASPGAGEAAVAS